MAPDVSIPATKKAAFDELTALIVELGAAAEIVSVRAKEQSARAVRLVGMLEGSADARGYWPEGKRA